MGAIYLRKYGVAATIDFALYELDGTDLVTTAAYAAGDVKIMKDEGAEANTTNSFTDEGTGYSIVLTATEMQAARIVLYLIDQTNPKAWLDRALVIETYGNASAMHAFDLDTATVDLSATTETQIDAIETDTNEIQGKLPTNKIMGSSVVTDKDDEIDAIKAKTDLLPTDPADESLIEAAITAAHATTDAKIDAVGDYVDTEITAIKAVTDTLSLAAIADAVHDETVEGTTTLRESTRLFLSALCGKLSGGGTGTLAFRDIGDTKDRITATVDANKNRTVMVLDDT